MQSLLLDHVSLGSLLEGTCRGILPADLGFGRGGHDVLKSPGCPYEPFPGAHGKPVS